MIASTISVQWDLMKQVKPCRLDGTSRRLGVHKICGTKGTAMSAPLASAFVVIDVRDLHPEVGLKAFLHGSDFAHTYVGGIFKYF